jgi:hypothetical protein
MRRTHIRYKEDSIKAFKPKLDEGLTEVINKVSDGIIDRVYSIVSGSAVEYIFVDNNKLT